MPGRVQGGLNALSRFEVWPERRDGLRCRLRHHVSERAFAEIIQMIEVQAGLCITEIRVTVDWAKRSEGAISANCTIVHAHNASTSDGQGTLRAAYSTESPGDGLSPSQD